MVTLLRAVPYHRTARRVTLPMDVLMRVSVGGGRGGERRGSDWARVAAAPTAPFGL